MASPKRNRPDVRPKSRRSTLVFGRCSMIPTPMGALRPILKLPCQIGAGAQQSDLALSSSPNKGITQQIRALRADVRSTFRPNECRAGHGDPHHRHPIERYPRTPNPTIMPTSTSFEQACVDEVQIPPTPADKDVPQTEENTESGDGGYLYAPLGRVKIPPHPPTRIFPKLGKHNGSGGGGYLYAP